MNLLLNLFLITTLATSYAGTHRSSKLRDKSPKNDQQEVASGEPQLSMEFAKRLTDAEAKKINLSGKAWKPDIANCKVTSIDRDWFRVTYLPIWNDKQEHLGGGFEFQINKNTAEIKGPLWHQ